MALRLSTFTLMSRFKLYRAAALVVAFAGIVLNFLAAAQLITLWLNFRWESESEWEWLSDRWRIDGVKLMGGIFCVYSAFAGAVSVVGLAGVIKVGPPLYPRNHLAYRPQNKPSLVRVFRDFYIADFSFCTSFAIIVVYAAFHTTTRTGICEEFSRHPELMRDMQEMGMNIENCELWLSRAALAIAAVMFTVVVIRVRLFVNHDRRHPDPHVHSSIFCSLFQRIIQVLCAHAVTAVPRVGMSRHTLVRILAPTAHAYTSCQHLRRMPLSWCMLQCR